MELAEVDALLQEEDALCAVAYLGKTDKRLPVGAPSLLATGGYNWMYPFLGSIVGNQMVECGGDEVFAVIPRSDAVLTVQKYNFSMDYNFIEAPGEVLAVSRDGQPLLIRCNTADTLPNTVLTLQLGRESVQYIPRVTLGTGELLMTADRIWDFTIHDFQPGGENG